MPGRARWRAPGGHGALFRRLARQLGARDGGAPETAGAAGVSRKGARVTSTGARDAAGSSGASALSAGRGNASPATAPGVRRAALASRILPVECDD